MGDSSTAAGSLDNSADLLEVNLQNCNIYSNEVADVSVWLQMVPLPHPCNHRPMGCSLTSWFDSRVDICSVNQGVRAAVTQTPPQGDGKGGSRR